MKKMFFTVLNATSSEAIDATFLRHSGNFLGKDNWIFLNNHHGNQIVNLTCAVVVPGPELNQSWSFFLPQFLSNLFQATQELNILCNSKKMFSSPNLKKISENWIAITARLNRANDTFKTIFELIGALICELIKTAKSSFDAALLTLASVISLSKAFGYEFNFNAQEFKEINLFNKQLVKIVAEARSTKRGALAIEWQSAINEWISAHCVISEDDFNAQTINRKRELRPFIEPSKIIIRSVEPWTPENLFISWDWKRLVPNNSMREKVLEAASLIATSF